MRKPIICRKGTFGYYLQIGYASPWTELRLPNLTVLVFRCLRNKVVSEIQEDFKKCNVF